jgi:hypothetical protein
LIPTAGAMAAGGVAGGIHSVATGRRERWLAGRAVVRANERGRRGGEDVLVEGRWAGPGWTRAGGGKRAVQNVTTT